MRASTSAPLPWEETDRIDSSGQRFAEALLDAADRIVRLPGVEAVGHSSRLPLENPGFEMATLLVEGRPVPSDPADLILPSVQAASPGYFDVLRLRLRSGRFYTRRDGAGSPRVVVVNETLAREAFGGEPAVGQRILWNAGGGPWEVIGVVADIRYQGLAATPSQAEMYVSTHQMARAVDIRLRTVPCRADHRRSAGHRPLPSGGGDRGPPAARRSTT